MRGILAALAALMAVVLCGCSGSDAGSKTTTTTAAKSGPTTAIASPPPTTTINTSTIDAMDAAYLDDDTSNRAYWQRASNA